MEAPAAGTIACASNSRFMDRAAAETARLALAALKLEWMLGPKCSKACARCQQHAKASPFTLSTGKNPIPGYPGDDAIGCKYGEECDCSVTPEEKSWHAVMEPIEKESEKIAREASKDWH